MPANQPRRRSGSVGVLFVCTGNICRSPLAAGLFNRYAKEQGLKRYWCDSAGIQAVVDAPAEPTVCTIAKAADADVSAHRARQILPEDFSRFHYLIALDLGHYDFLCATKPSIAKSTIALLLSFTKHRKGAEVPDPYGQSRKVFEKSAKLIDEGVRGLLRELQQVPAPIARDR
ncbi:MAG: low molecular weight protein-tyrosine-phosphatase [Gammaproteobacteria bacterium]